MQEHSKIFSPDKKIRKKLMVTLGLLFGYCLFIGTLAYTIKMQKQALTPMIEFEESVDERML